MTDTLPEGAPEPGSAASEESVVPKARFDGLMSAYQRDKARLEAEIEALKARLDSTPEPEVRDVAQRDDLDTIRAEIGELRELLLGERLEKARYEAVAKYPEVAPLADLLVGSSPEEIEAMAAEVATRLAGLSGTTPATETPPVGPPEKGEPEPPTQSAPPLGPNVADVVSEAIQKGDFTAYLEAVASRAAQESATA